MQVRKRLLLTIEQLQASLSYDPENGLFTNTTSIPGRHKAGSVAGTKNKLKGYIVISRSGRNYPAHRLAWAFFYGRWPVCIDHINGTHDDNRITNLRECLPSQNAMNHGRRRDSKQPHVGIQLQPDGRWIAKCQKKRLGRFATAEEARAAYEVAAREAFGPFKRAA